MTFDKNWRTEEEFVDEERFCREILNRMSGSSVDKGIFPGTCGWSYKDWLGPFYPVGTRQRDYLHVYSRVFRSVEVDTTFYSVPQESVVKSWVERSASGFTFSVRFPRAITHEKNGLDPANPVIKHFLTIIAGLGEKLGALLIHLPPDFPPEELGRLRRFLSTLPTGFRYAVDFRHAGWLNDDTLNLLAEFDMAWVITVGSADASERPLTTDFTYLRWLGDRRLKRFGRVVIDRRLDMADWANWIESRRDRLSGIYSYFNNHYSGHAPASVLALLSLLKQPVPELPDSADRVQGELFA
ncbi:MAG: DUF72 domain-containing protein [bacterium]|nr:DUF72 domain-containing protein [bacterium]